MKKPSHRLGELLQRVLKHTAVRVVFDEGARASRVALHLTMTLLVIYTTAGHHGTASPWAIAIGVLLLSCAWLASAAALSTSVRSALYKLLRSWERFDGTVRGLLTALRALELGTERVLNASSMTPLAVVFITSYYALLALSVALFELALQRFASFSLIGALQKHAPWSTAALLLGLLSFYSLNRSDARRRQAAALRRKAVTGLTDSPGTPRRSEGLRGVLEALIPVWPPLLEPPRVRLSLVSFPEYNLGAYLKALALRGYRVEGALHLEECLRGTRLDVGTVKENRFPYCMARVYGNGNAVGYVLGFVSEVDVRPILARYSSGLSYRGAPRLSEPMAYLLMLSLNGRGVEASTKPLA